MSVPRCGGEKVYYKCVGQRRQTQRHLAKSRVDMNQLSWAMWGGWKEREGEKWESGIVTKSWEVQKGQATKMSGLYREESLGEVHHIQRAGDFRVGGRVNSVTGRE